MKLAGKDLDVLVFHSLWWILWLSSVVLLRFFVRDMDGIRLQPANVYYLVLRYRRFILDAFAAWLFCARAFLYCV